MNERLLNPLYFKQAGSPVWAKV